MTLPAPTSWWCDSCGKPVSASQGHIIYDEDANGKYVSFRIVHNDPECLRFQSPSATDVSLLGSIGPDGLDSLLENLDAPRGQRRGQSSTIGDLGAFVDLIRRLHLPHYEDARRVPGAFDTDDISGTANFSQARLAQLLERQESE